MAAAKIAEILFATKIVYDKMIHDIPSIHQMLYDRLQKLDLKWNGQGRFFEMPLHTEGGLRGIGPLEEGGAMAPFSPQVGTSFRVFPKTNAFGIEIGHRAKVALKKGPGAFVDYLGWEIEKRHEWSREGESRQYWGDGFNVMGVISAVSSSATVPVFTMDKTTNMFNFRVGMRVDVYDPEYALADRSKGPDNVDNGQTVRDKGWQITAVNIAAKTLTMSGDTTGGGDIPAAGDWLLLENAGVNVNAAVQGEDLDSGKAMTGLRQLFSDGNILGYTQNVSLSTYPELKANRYTSGSDRNITLDMLQQAEDDILKRTGKTVNFVAFNTGQRRKLLALGLPDVRHESQKIKLGFTEIDWNGHKFFVDPLAPVQQIFLCSMDCLGRTELFEWGSVDANELGERLTDKLDYQLAYAHHGNLCVINPAGGAWIENLNEP